MQVQKYSKSIKKKFDKITMIDGGNGNGDGISKLVNQLPQSVVNLTEMIENATGVDILSSFKKTDKNS